MKPLPFAPLPASLPATVPFIGPETLERERGKPFSARIGANENGFGPSPLAIETMRGAAAEVWKYGDATSYALQHALAAHLGIPANHISVGEGVDGLLGLFVRLMIAPGDAVVTSDGAYPTFNYHVTGFGGVLHKVPYLDDREDIEGLVARARETGARIVYLANPDNPMGSWHKGTAIEAMLNDLPEGTMLLLDEAYAEFAPADAIPKIAADDPRVIRMRTFSKAYGMAGARIGYTFAHPDIIAGFDRVRNHFGVNRIAQAGAIAALADDIWLAQIKHDVQKSRERIALIAKANGMKALPSATNFVAIDTGRDGEFARNIMVSLEAEGVFIRMPGVAPLNRCIRISCAPAEELVLLAEKLPLVMERLGAG